MALERSSPNRRVIRLWLSERRLQLIVSPEVVKEYLSVFECLLHMDEVHLENWRSRFVRDARCTRVGSTGWSRGSRDPSDNVFLAAARAGRAKFLITNDSDLLELLVEARQELAFAILTPRDFLLQARLS